MSTASSSPSGDDRLRAGNADREKVVAQLNAAFAEGRLDVTELDERVAAAYAAKTLGELVPLTADLPGGQRQKAAPPARQDRAPVRYDAPSGVVRWAPVTGALGLFLINVLIWGIVSISTGNLIYFWPIWTAIPLALALIGMVAGAGSAHDHRNRDRYRDR
jgi:DUF1707 SHOCT-like domain